MGSEGVTMVRLKADTTYARAYVCEANGPNGTGLLDVESRVMIMRR